MLRGHPPRYCYHRNLGRPYGGVAGSGEWVFDPMETDPSTANQVYMGVCEGVLSADVGHLRHDREGQALQLLI